MKKALSLLLLLSSLLFANSSILIINSYHKGYEFSDSIINGIEKVIYKKPKIDLNVLYMDSKRITSQKYFKNLKELYKVQLENRKYDLVIAVDRFAYEFVLEYYDEFFTNEKVFAVGLESFSKQRLKNYKLEGKVSALIEKRDLKANVQLIEQFMPTIKKLYIIDDNSLNSTHTQPLIKELYENFDEKYELIYLKERSLKDLEKRFSKHEFDSAILFVRFYKDLSGKLNKNNDIANFIKHSKVPIFITDSIFNKKGAVGGKIVDLDKFGVKSGQMALDIIEDDYNRVLIYDDLYYVLDEKKLDQFALLIEQLPLPYDKYQIINKKETFFDKYRTFIDAVFIISPLLVFLILGLLHNIYLKMNNAKKLRQRVEFDSILLNAIESPIFWQDDKGVIIESNKKFCDFINLEANDIYGKKLDEVKKSNKVDLLKKVLSKYIKNKDKYSQFKVKVEDKRKIYYIKQASYFDKKTKNSGTVTILTDITKEKEYEIEREKNQEFIIQQSKLAEIGEIFSSIAHQWKSPLVEITTIAQESFYSIDNKELENQSYVKDIMTQVKYMNDTINDFQDFIRPSNEKKVFDVYEAITNMLEIVEHNIKYNYIKVDIKIDENINFNVYGFRNEFMQSILNIINNAKDELSKKDLKDRKLNIHFFNVDNKLVIKIKDNAGGIKVSNIKKIFKPYFTTKQKGHGIGLYMAKVIIEDKMNGKIKAYNNDLGACFEIELENVN